MAKRLNWTLGMWVQKKIYDFYKGAWVCGRELVKKMETVKLDILKKFPLYQEDGTDSTVTLSEWFYIQASDIATRFDQYNGIDSYV